MITLATVTKLLADAGVDDEKRKKLTRTADKVYDKLKTHKLLATRVFALLTLKAKTLIKKRDRLTLHELTANANELRAEIESILIQRQTRAALTEPVALAVVPSVIDEAFAEHSARTGTRQDEATVNEKMTIGLILEVLFCALALAVGIDSGPGCSRLKM